AVHADDAGAVRVRVDRHRPVDGSEDALDYRLHEVAQAGAIARLRLDGGDDAIGGGDADVGRDQQLLERVDRIDVDRARALVRRIGHSHDLVEAIDDLLLGAGKTIADTGKDVHGRTLVLGKSGSRIAAGFDDQIIKSPEPGYRPASPSL